MTQYYNDGIWWTYVSNQFLKSICGGLWGQNFNINIKYVYGKNFLYPMDIVIYYYIMIIYEYNNKLLRVF